jgi:hypothetical protein
MSFSNTPIPWAWTGDVQSAEGVPRACNDAIAACEQDVQQSFAEVMRALHDAGSKAKEAMVIESLTAVKTYDPLTFAEFVVLGVAVARSMAHVLFSHADIYEFTFTHFDHPLTFSVIYRAVGKLVQRGLIESRGAPHVNKRGKDPEVFSIRSAGVDVFWLSLLNARIQNTSRSEVA